MDKYLKAIDMTEHPENYSDEELATLFSDPELREIYDLLCLTERSLCPVATVPEKRVEEEWKKFAAKEQFAEVWPRRAFSRRGSRRGVAIIGIALTSVAALAIGLGIMSHRATVNTSPDLSTVPEITATASVADTSVSEVMPTDTLVAGGRTVVFENERLGNILMEITQYYGLKLMVNNNASENIRLFFQWNPGKGEEEVVRQLNNFARINLELTNDTLTLR